MHKQRNTRHIQAPHIKLVHTVTLVSVVVLLREALHPTLGLLEQEVKPILSSTPATTEIVSSLP